MPRTPLGYYRRNPFMRYGYGAFANYRLASVTRGVGNAAAQDGSSSPLSGDTDLTVTQTAPTAAGNPSIAGRGSWPGEAGTSSGNMSAVRPEGGIAVSWTAAVGGIGPGVYPRVTPASSPINATVDVAVDHGDGSSDNFTGFADTVDHDYTAAGTYTPKLVVTDQLGRVSTQPFATGAITVVADTTDPSFTAGPTGSDGGAQTIDVGFTVDDNGTLYAVVVPADDAAPSIAEVIAGTASGGGAAEASGDEAVVATTPGTLTGLTPTSGAGTYNVYVVMSDEEGNTQSGAPTLIEDVVVA